MGRNYADHTGAKNPNYKTGLANRGKRCGIYNSWQNMKQRCLNKNHEKYHRYGGRGITICADWLTIAGFAAWALSSGWQQGLTIDRRDNDGSYCPDNCQWVTATKNSRKKSTTKLTIGQAAEIRMRLSTGEKPQILADEYGVSAGTIWFIDKNITHQPEQTAPLRV